jgi:ParB family transcriptional regulator, chromosome partitioning protein
LKEQGLISPYLRAFVVARINPLRWVKEIPSAESVLKTMIERVTKFKTDKIRPQDLVRTGGALDEE